GPKHLRELYGLVDHNAGRRVGGDAKLVQRDAQHVAVDARHLIDRALGRELGDLRVEILAMGEHPLDEVPGKRAGFLRQSGAKRAALPGLLWVGAIEVDLEEGLEGEPPRGMAASARRPLAHAADATPSPSASRRRVATARSATSIARRIMFARARTCVTTEIPPTPRSGAGAYGA